MRRAAARCGPEFQQDLARGLRKPTKMAVEQIREAILHADMAGFRKPGTQPFTAHIPSKGVKRPIARAVQGEVKVHPDPRALIVIRLSQVPPRVRPLLAYFTGRRKRLRHPVMGNKHVWVGQRVPDVWHIPNVESYRRAVREVLDAIPQKVRGR